MKYAYEKECVAAGFNPKEVEQLAKNLSRHLRKAHEMGIHLFGGSGSGTLRTHDGNQSPLVLARVDGHVDGGDGGEHWCEKGLLRGEG